MEGKAVCEEVLRRTAPELQVPPDDPARIRDNFALHEAKLAET